MTKMIEIKFEKGGTFVAELFEKDAPKNCKTLWDALPMESEMIHSALSGQMVWGVVKNYIKVEDVHRENQLVYGNLPGTIGLESYDEDKTHLNRSEVQIIYGGRFFPTDPFQGTFPINRVGIIKDNLDELLKIGMNIREFGKQKITIKKIDVK